MSFCAIDKLYIIKQHVKGIPALEQLSGEEKNELKLATLDALEEIERREFEYRHL